MVTIENKRKERKNSMKFKKLVCVMILAMLSISIAACGNKAANGGDKAADKKEGTKTEASAGKSEGAINVISREQGSGTRSAFVELTGVQEKVDGKEVDKTTEEATVQNSTEGVITTVQNDKSAIGYISLGSLNSNVKALTVEGVKASEDDIKNGSYKLSRPFNICYKEGLDEKTKDFLAFIESDEGQKIVQQSGYVPHMQGKKYEAKNNESHIIIAGSTSVTPLMEKLVEAYKVHNPKFQADIQATGSSAGIKSAMDGSAQLGMASRQLKDDEKAALKVDVIARDGIAVIVNKDNSLNDIKMSNLKDIFTGKVSDWKDLNGK